MPLAVDIQIPLFTDLDFTQVFATYQSHNGGDLILLTDAYERYSNNQEVSYTLKATLFS